jgi:hypothetical protein
MIAKRRFHGSVSAIVADGACGRQAYDGRLPRTSKDGKLRALQDCVLFLQAQRLGLVVLNANVSDYDILLELMPMDRALFYRHKMKPSPTSS